MTSSRTDSALVDVTMPQMGVSVAEGTVVGWRVEVGDRIGADQTICDISTDKIDTEVPAPVAGVVAEILVPVDETVDVGTVLARIATSGSGPAPDGPPATPEPSAEPQAVPVQRGGQRCRRHAAGRGRPAPLLPRRPADRRRARHRPLAGGGHRARRARAQAGRARARRGRRRRVGAVDRGPAAAHREPVPPGPGSGGCGGAGGSGCCGGQWTALADAAPDRRAHEALA